MKHKIDFISVLVVNAHYLKSTISEIWPRQDFQTQTYYDKVKGQIKATPSINILHLNVSKIQPGQAFPARQDTMDERVKAVG